METVATDVFNLGHGSAAHATLTVPVCRTTPEFPNLSATGFSPKVKRPTQCLSPACFILFLSVRLWRLKESRGASARAHAHQLVCEPRWQLVGCVCVFFCFFAGHRGRDKRPDHTLWRAHPSCTCVRPKHTRAQTAQQMFASTTWSLSPSLLLVCLPGLLLWSQWRLCSATALPLQI